MKHGREFGIDAAFWWDPPGKPKLLFHALWLWVLIFFAVPLYIPLSVTARHLPFLRGMAATGQDLVGVNLPSLILLTICFGLVYLLIWLAYWLLWVRGPAEVEGRNIVVAINHGQGLADVRARGLVILALAGVTAALWGRAPAEFFLLLSGCVLALAMPTINPAKLRDRKRHRQLIKIRRDINEEEVHLRGEEGIVEKSYVWHFTIDTSLPNEPERVYQITIPSGEARYREFAERPHDVHGWNSYANYVVEGITPEIALIGEHLRRIAAEEEMTPFQLVRNVFAFTRQFEYGYDDETKGVAEYPRYPIEMLWDEIGDCECHAILAAALLRYLGFDTILLAAAVNTDDGHPNHMAVGVAGAEEMAAMPDTTFYTDASTGRNYFYCEATPSTLKTTRESPDWGWHIGEVRFEDLSAIVPIYLHGEVLEND